MEVWEADEQTDGGLRGNFTQSIFTTFTINVTKVTFLLRKLEDWHSTRRTFLPDS